MQLPGIIYICSGVVAWSRVAVRLKIAADIPACQLWEKAEQMHHGDCSPVCLVLSLSCPASNPSAQARCRRMDNRPFIMLAEITCFSQVYLT